MKAERLPANEPGRLEALRERAQLGRVLEASLNEIYLFDAKTLRFEFVNAGARANMGYSAEQLRQLTPVNLKPEFTEDSFRALIVPLLRHERSKLVFETLHRRADGSTYPVEVHLQLVEEPGHPLFVAIILDLTERKAAEAALRRSEERFRELAETIEEVFWITDPAAQTLYVSPAYEKIWGRSRESLQREPGSWMTAIHPDDRERVARAAARRRALGSSDEEYRIVRPDGEVRWIRDRAFPVRDAGGAIERIVGVAHDITDAKLAQEELRHREDQFRLLIENASDLITVIDERAVIRYQSPAVRRVLGYRPEDLIGRSAFEFIHAEDAPRTLEALQRALAHPDEPVSVEFRFRHHNGQWRTLQSVGRVLPAAGDGPTMVVNSRDLTETRQLEEQFRQAQKMEAIGQLAGGVAHDLNNILTVIQGYGAILTAGESTPHESSESAQQIVQACERAANLTRQLLAFSRRQVMQPRYVDLNEIVTTLVKMLQRIVGEDVRVQLNLHQRPLPTRADTGMLDQVLLNLVVNARDAMPGGGRLIIDTGASTLTAAEASARTDAAPGGYVWLRVTDTGHGVAPEHLSRIFEPFYTTKESGKGTGLGLATVFGIVKQHGGFVTVESEVGRGASFQVFLPGAGDTNPDEEEPGPKATPRGGSETILLVEDDTAVRVLTRAILEGAGYRVLEVADGPAAVQTWEQHGDDIRLLLTDLVIPEGISGRELAARLQARKTGLRVIFTSGYSADIAGRELLLKEGQNFIQKPSSPSQLLETVRRCLDA